MKTAVNILSEKMKLKHDEAGSICLTVDSITDAMKEYARQVAEEYRDDLLRELPQTFSKSDPVKYRYKIGQYIMDADIKQFLS